VIDTHLLPGIFIHAGEFHCRKPVETLQLAIKAPKMAKTNETVMWDCDVFV
jgi:hypothetical protein